MRAIRFLFLAFVLFTPFCTNAQILRLGSDNKSTIEATTTEKISVPSDSAIVKIGFNHTADTKDAAYNETVRLGAKIIKALIDAGISKEEIQTETLNVGREEEPSRNISSSPKMRYSAEQQWRIHVVAADAQKTHPFFDEGRRGIFNMQNAPRNVRLRLGRCMDDQRTHCQDAAS